MGNLLQVDRLKPNTVYQISIEVHPNLAWPNSNRFKVFMITEYSDGTYVESTGSTTQLNYYQRLDNAVRDRHDSQLGQ